MSATPDAAPVAVDRAQAARFLAALAGPGDPPADATLVLAAREPAADRWHAARFAPAEPERAADTAVRWAEDGRDVYACRSLMRADLPAGRRGGNADARHALAVMVDCDRDDGGPVDADAARALARDLALPLAPTAVVATGGGAQLWWTLAEPDPLDGDGARADHERAARGLAELARRRAPDGWTVDHTGDLARVGRVPGTLNRKYEPPRPVALADLDGTQRYSLDDLLAHVPEDTPAPPAGGNGHGDVDPAALAEPLDEHGLAALVANDAEAARVWDGDRSRLRDTSVSGGDLALASRAARAGWPDGQLAALVRAHRHHHGDPQGKAGRRDYLERTIAKARNGVAPTSEADDAAAEGEAGEGGQAAVTGRPCTDAGNAERLVDRHGDALRYAHGRSDWLVWRGDRWAVDDDEAVVRLATDTARSVLAEAAATDDDDRRSRLAKHAAASERRERLRAMVDLARADERIGVQPRQLDADAHLLNVANGTVDLRTGELRAHRRGDLLTKTTGVDYDPDAGDPLWGRFLADAVPDRDAREWLQRLAGYAATGHATEDVIVVIHGPGGSGKSTFRLALAAALGDYAETAEPEAFAQRRNAGGPRPELARLVGVRLAVIPEVEGAQRLAAGLLKNFAGGDPITTRALYRDPFTFTPQATLVIVGNQRPHVPDDDTGVWRRLREVPFTTRPARPDPAVRRRLADPRDPAARAVLAWTVEGARRWHEHGLGEPPATITRATADYRAAMNPLAAWLADRCTLGVEAWTASADLRADYEGWAERHQVEPVSEGAMREALRRLGGLTPRRRGNPPRRGWAGIALAEADHTAGTDGTDGVDG